MMAGSGAPLLVMRGMRKRFGATIALDGVDLSCASGEVLALVGENGAGKSTLMKILSGALRADDGEMEFGSIPFTPRGPLEARNAGIAMIYQELNLAPDLTVEENLVLGTEHTRAGFILRSRHFDRVSATLAALDHPEIRPETRVRDLAPAARQLVEIARALLSDARVLVMDEPTSSLGVADIEHLFGVIAELQRSGVSVIYISHFLEEVRRVADRYLVLRDGRAVGSGAIVDVDEAELVELMIGRRLQEFFPRVDHKIGDVVLRVDRLSGRKLPVEATFEMRAGEVLGLAGLVGAGRTELLRAIFGLDEVQSGSVRVQTLTAAKHRPHERLLEGVGLLSEDRKAEGIASSLSVAENIALSRLKPYTRYGWLDLGRIRRTARDWMTRLGIRARDPDQSVAELSGGHQQRVALARLLHHDVDVLLLDEPTRGIDVASKVEIYRWIGELAAQGKAVLFVSSYIPELLGVCDRIAVLHRGRIVADRPAEQWTEHGILTVATSGREAVA